MGVWVEGFIVIKYGSTERLRREIDCLQCFAKKKLYNRGVGIKLKTGG